jgi:HK97 family phage portal protein
VWATQNGVGVNILGLTITRTKALQLASVDSRGGWLTGWIQESFRGAWQTNVEINIDSVLTHPTVFACVTLICGDIAKNRVMLVEEIGADIWEEVESNAFSPVLRQPNSYQMPIDFYQTWLISKLVHGNTYVLKQRDLRGLVVAEYVLDPSRVRPLIAPDGSVFYELHRDDLSAQPNDNVIAPASELIHDVFYPLYHPLVGVGPLHAAGLASITGVNMQNNSARFAANGSNPGGVVMVPGPISIDQAKTLKERWEKNYGGANSGRVAVLSDGMKYEPLKIMSAVDAQVVEQLKWADEKICAAFHVPGFMVGVGPMPPYNNTAGLKDFYYSQCLQVLIEKIEQLQDKGLGLSPNRIDGRRMGTQFDTTNLLRMVQNELIAAEKDAVGAGIKSPDEARRELNLLPVTGGDTPYLQQQNWPLALLANRQLATNQPTPPAALPTSEDASASNVVAFRSAVMKKAERDGVIPKAS